MSETLHTSTENNEPCITDTFARVKNFMNAEELNSAQKLFFDTSTGSVTEPDHVQREDTLGM